MHKLNKQIDNISIKKQSKDFLKKLKKGKIKMKNKISIASLLFLLVIFPYHITKSQWVQMSVGLESRDVTCLASDSNMIYAGTYNYGVYLSTNNGISWTQTPLNNRYIFSIAADGENVFSGTLCQGI